MFTSYYAGLPLRRSTVTAKLEHLALHVQEVGEGEREDDHDEA
jgi:hypothetical protein